MTHLTIKFYITLIFCFLSWGYASTWAVGSELNDNDISEIANKFLCSENLDEAMETVDFPFNYDNKADITSKYFLFSVLKNVRREKEESGSFTDFSCKKHKFKIMSADRFGTEELHTIYVILRVTTIDKSWPHGEGLRLTISNNGKIVGVED